VIKYRFVYINKMRFIKYYIKLASKMRRRRRGAWRRRRRRWTLVAIAVVFARLSFGSLMFLLSHGTDGALRFLSHGQRKEKYD